jgi:methionyl-tRNA formyltransferase
MQNKLNFVFWGTPDVASETLEILKQAGYLPYLIVTSPDRPAGRKMLLTPPSVKLWAEENKIPYIQPEKITESLSIFPEEVYGVLGTSAQAGEPSKAIPHQRNMRGEQNTLDLFVVVAYGKIMPENIINMPKFGSINIHYSLLPKYRGASPVESAILNGDTTTGITIQQMHFEMDSGPILAQEKVKIEPDEKAPDLRKRLIKIGGELLVKTLPKIANREIKPIPQDKHEATHCAKIKKEDGLIDLNGDAIKNYNKFRAYATWPRTFFFKRHLSADRQERIIITKAKLEDNKFVIERIIPENGKEKDYKN